MLRNVGELMNIRGHSLRRRDFVAEVTTLDYILAVTVGDTALSVHYKDMSVS